MHHYLLQKTYCPLLDGYGLRLVIPSSVSPMLPCSGILAAHDIIEHVNGPTHIGSLNDEVQALGAYMCCRGIFRDSYKVSVKTFVQVLNLLACKYMGDEELVHFDPDYDAENIDLLRKVAFLMGKIAEQDYSIEYAKYVSHYVAMGAHKYFKRFGSFESGYKLFEQIQVAVDTIVDIGVPHDRYTLMINNNKLAIGIYNG